MNSMSSELPSLHTIVFFINPWVSTEALRKFSIREVNQCVEMIQALQKAGHRLIVISNEFTRQKLSAYSFLSTQDIFLTPDRELLEQDYATDELFHEALIRPLPADLDKLKKHVFGTLNTVPDIILSWDIPLHAATSLFPNTLVVEVGEGMFPCSPFPPMVEFNILNRKLPDQCLDPLFTTKIHPSDILFFERLQHYYVKHILAEMSPYTREELDPYQSFSALYLVWLGQQENKSAKAIGLESLLQQVPSTVGIVITDLALLSAQNDLSAEEAYFCLKEKYPNLIFRSSFQGLPHIEQYLLPLVEGVITLSPSVGLQAIFCQKAVWIPDESELNSFVITESLTQIDDAKPLLAEEEIRRVFAFLFKYLQFAQERVISSNWLSERLIRAQAAYQQGASHLVLCEAFEEEDEVYRQLFFKENSKDGYLNLREPLKILDRFKYPEIRKKFRRFEQEADFINDPKNAVISLGIFDVLIELKIQRQADIFRLMTPEVLRITQGRVLSFEVLRQYGETCVQAEAKLAGWKAINLEAIYHFFVKQALLTPEEAEKILALEIATLKQVSCVRESGKRFLEAALYANKRVVLVGQTVYPVEIVEEILTHLNIKNYEAIYLSNAFNANKEDGELFAAMIRMEEIAPNALLHIGHDYHADLIAAERKGIRVHYIKRAVDRMYESEAFGVLYRLSRQDASLWDSIYLGMVATRFYSDLKTPVQRDSHFNGSHFELGYVGLGPIIAAFAIWLARKAKQENVGQLFFLSREGFILKQAFDILAPSIANHIYSAYLYGSRSALLKATITTLEDIFRIGMVGLSQPCPLQTYLWDRFHVSFLDIPQEIQAEFPAYQPDTVIHHRDLEQVLPFLARIKEIIFEASKPLAQRYQAYLKQVGFFDHANKAVIDIGYGGSMQASLAALTGDDLLKGYYLLASHKSDHLKKQHLEIAGFLGESLEAYSMEENLANIVFFETIMSTCEGSLQAITQKSDGTYRPLLDHAGVDLRRTDILTRIHGGAIAFCRDLVNRYGEYLEELEFDVRSPFRMLRDYLSFPAPIDGKLMEGLAFDNRFRSAGLSYFVPPKKPGNISEEDINTAVETSIWKLGTEAYWRNEKIQRETGNLLVDYQCQKIQELQTEQARLLEVEQQHTKLENVFAQQKELLQERTERLVEATRQLAAQKDYDSLKVSLLACQGQLNELQGRFAKANKIVEERKDYPSLQQTLKKTQGILKERTERLVIADRELANQKDYYQVKADYRKKEWLLRKKEEEIQKLKEKLGERSSLLKQKTQNLASAKKNLRRYEWTTLQGLFHVITRTRWKEKK